MNTTTFCIFSRTARRLISKSDAMALNLQTRKTYSRREMRRHSSGKVALQWWQRVTFTAIVLLSVVTYCRGAGHHRNIDMCEPIRLPLCMGMPYNMTRMPNHLHHTIQENARLSMEPYTELISRNCSATMLFFLCAMFVPICTPQFQQEAIPPCRSVCEGARRGCEPLMNEHNISWPDDLDCNRLPEYDNGVCVSPEAIVSSMPEDAKNSTKKSTKKHTKNKDCKCPKRIKPSRRAFRRGKFDYAIAARVKHITHVPNSHTVVHVMLGHVLKRGLVHLQPGRDVEIWTNSSCVCPSLRLHKDYLIVGRENALLNKLLLGTDSLVSRWNKKWATKFKRWTAKRNKNKTKKRRCRKKRCRKNKKKPKLRCHVTKTGGTRTRIKCTQPRKDRQKLDNNSAKRTHTNSPNRTRIRQKRLGGQNRE